MATLGIGCLLGIVAWFLANQLKPKEQTKSFGAMLLVGGMMLFAIAVVMEGGK